MGGESNYGLSLGFGARDGFVEHYWYKMPDTARGQTYERFWARDYVVVNESAPLHTSGGLLGDENEEYAAAWSNEWRTHAPAQKGGAWAADAPRQNGTARWGKLDSFPYRYLMSSLRALQVQARMGTDEPEWPSMRPAEPSMSRG